MNETDTYDAVVVGGGMAGLSAAWHLRERNILLLEQGPRVGGRVHSLPRGEYWLNFGAHLFPGVGSLVDSLCSELGLDVVAVPDSIMGLAVNGTVLGRGPVESYPFRLPLSPAERLEFIRAGLRLGAAIRRYNRIAHAADVDGGAGLRDRALAFLDDRSFQDYMGPMGGSVEHIFRCAAHRATAEPEELSAGCGVGLFAHVWGGKKALIARNLIGGSAVLPQTLARQLGARVRVEATVTRVAAAADAVTVTYRADGAEWRVRARQAIVATPAFVSRRLVADLPADVAHALDGIAYGPFLSLALLTRERGPMPWDHVYAVATPNRSFDMFFNHANVLRSGARREGGSVMVYAGAGLAARLLDKSDDEIRATFLPDLYALYPQMNGLIEESVVQRWPCGNTFATPGRHALQPALERPVGHGNIHLAGDYLAELGTMEAAARTGRDAARRIRAALTAPAPTA